MDGLLYSCKQLSCLHDGLPFSTSNAAFTDKTQVSNYEQTSSLLTVYTINLTGHAWGSRNICLTRVPTFFDRLKNEWAPRQWAMLKLFSTSRYQYQEMKLKFWSVFSYSSFDLEPKCLQLIAKTEELVLTVALCSSDLSPAVWEFALIYSPYSKYQWKNIFSKNGARLRSTTPETCKICAKECSTKTLFVASNSVFSLSLFFNLYGLISNH